MGFFDGFLGGENPVQTPAFEAQKKADRAALTTRGDLADRLSAAIGGGEGRVEEIMARRGGLSPEQQARMDRISGTIQGGTPEMRAETRDAMIEQQESRGRRDVAEIFGRQLSQGVAHAGLQTGALKEKMPKQSGFDSFLGAVTGIAGALGG